MLSAAARARRSQGKWSGHNLGRDWTSSDHAPFLCAASASARFALAPPSGCGGPSGGSRVQRLIGPAGRARRPLALWARAGLRGSRAQAVHISTPQLNAFGKRRLRLFRSRPVLHNRPPRHRQSCPSAGAGTAVPGVPAPPLPARPFTGGGPVRPPSPSARSAPPTRVPR